MCVLCALLVRREADVTSLHTMFYDYLGFGNTLFRVIGVLKYVTCVSVSCVNCGTSMNF